MPRPRQESGESCQGLGKNLERLAKDSEDLRKGDLPRHVSKNLETMSRSWHVSGKTLATIWEDLDLPRPQQEPGMVHARTARLNRLCPFID